LDVGIWVGIVVVVSINKRPGNDSVVNSIVVNVGVNSSESIIGCVRIIVVVREFIELLSNKVVVGLVFSISRYVLRLRNSIGGVVVSVGTTIIISGVNHGSFIVGPVDVGFDVGSIGSVIANIVVGVSSGGWVVDLSQSKLLVA